MAGGGSFLGGAIGSGAAGKIKDSGWHEEEAQRLQKQYGAFGSENIKGALTAAASAGIGQQLKLGKEAAAAKLADPKMSEEAVKAISKGKGFDFAGSKIGGW